MVSAEEIAERLRAETRARDEHASARAERLRAQLPEAAHQLRAAGAKRIWSFGSLAEGRAQPESDVDLAVEDLPSERYFEMLASLMELFGTRVDLVELRTAPRSLRARVVETGVEL